MFPYNKRFSFCLTSSGNAGTYTMLPQPVFDVTVTELGWGLFLGLFLILFMAMIGAFTNPDTVSSSTSNFLATGNNLREKNIQ